MFLCIIYSEIMIIFLHYKQYLLYIPVADTDIGPNSTKTISALYNKNIHIYRSVNRCNSINIKKQAQSPICFMLTFTFLCLHFNLLFFCNYSVQDCAVLHSPYETAVVIRKNPSLQVSSANRSKLRWDFCF